MRISNDALERCEPVFEAYVKAMGVLTSFQQLRFGETYDGNSASETLRVLSSYQIDRSRGVYCLAVNGLVWDAEIVLRVVYEAFSKIVLIASTPNEQRDELVDEFWTILSDIYDRKGAAKAASAEKLASEFDADAARVFAALQDSEKFNVKPVANKSARSRIEKRWSFSGIIEHLVSSKSSLAPVGLDALTHSYAMASHLAHASSKAFELMEDRRIRGDDLVALEVGHVCRMLSDAVSLQCFGLFWIDHCCIGSREMPKVLHSVFESFHEATRPHQEAFNRSQDEFYGQ